MLLNCCTQYVSKFGKLSSCHGTRNGQVRREEKWLGWDTCPWEGFRGKGRLPGWGPWLASEWFKPHIGCPGRESDKRNSNPLAGWRTSGTSSRAMGSLEPTSVQMLFWTQNRREGVKRQDWNCVAHNHPHGIPTWAKQSPALFAPQWSESCLDWGNSLVVRHYGHSNPKQHMKRQLRKWLSEALHISDSGLTATPCTLT